jgi:hypothetical protein
MRVVPYQWIGLGKDLNNYRFFNFLFCIFDLEYLIEFKALSRLMQKRIQPPDFLDHDLHVLTPGSFPPNRLTVERMRERHQLFFGLRLMSKEFQHPAIQTQIEQHFGGFFLSNKSVPACRKTGFYANSDPNK